MPRARKRIADSVPVAGFATPGPETAKEPVSGAAKEAADDLSKLIAGMSSANSWVEVFRIDRRTGDKKRLTKYPANQVDGDFLVSEWGGGKYYCRIWSTDDKGKLDYGGHVTLDVDETIYPPRIPPWLKQQQDEERKKEAAANGVPVAPPVVVAAPAAEAKPNLIELGILQIFAAGQKMQEMQTQMMMTFMERMSNGGGNNNGNGDVMKLVLAMIEHRADPNEIARQWVDTMTKANARTPEPPSALADALKLIDSIENRVARRNPGNGESTGDPWVDLVKSMAPDTLAIAKQMIEARMIEARRNAGLPAPAAGTHPGAPGHPALPPPPPAPAAYVPPVVLSPSPDPALVTGPVTDPALGTSSGTDVVLPLWAPFVRPFVPELLNYAQRGKNPETVADLLLSKLEVEDQLGAAAGLLVKPGFADEWCLAFPEFAPYRGWVTALIANARTQLEDDGGGDADEETT